MPCRLPGGRLHPVELQSPWGVVFYHDVDSFNELWRQVTAETGTRWVVDALLVDLSQWGVEREDCDWMAADRRRLNFVVTRSQEGIESSLT